MAGPTSRYASVGTGNYTTAGGREVRYFRRRFLPQPASLRTQEEIILIAGDRLDLLAARSYGDSLQFWRICDANSAMNPSDLVRADRTLNVPIPEFQEPL